MGSEHGFLAGLRQAGDPSADAVIDELARTQLPPSAARWLEHAAEVPAWADHDRLERHWTASGVFPGIDPEPIRIARAEPA